MSDLAGQTLGQYQILSRIARASAATIYKAYQPKLDRYVAKVLSSQFVEDSPECFIQEARAIAQLDHPNIAPVLDGDAFWSRVCYSCLHANKSLNQATWVVSYFARCMAGAGSSRAFP